MINFNQQLFLLMMDCDLWPSLSHLNHHQSSVLGFNCLFKSPSTGGAKVTATYQATRKPLNTLSRQNCTATPCYVYILNDYASIILNQTDKIVVLAVSQHGRWLLIAQVVWMFHRFLNDHHCQPFVGSLSSALFVWNPRIFVFGAGLVGEDVIQMATVSEASDNPFWSGRAPKACEHIMFWC